jgi:hypothetical protein
MKAHNGTLLNECADMLATKGVMNEQRLCSAQFVRELGEDTDEQEYSILDWEETPLVSGRGDIYPAGKASMMKDGDRDPLGQYLSESEPASDAHGAFDEPEYPLGTSEATESDTPPMPVDYSDDDAPRLSVRVCDVPTSPPAAKPNWWSEAWGKLDGRIWTDGGSGWTEARSPKDLKFDCRVGDFWAFDFPNTQMIEDQDGNQLKPGPDNSVLGAVVGVLFEQAHATLTNK